MESKPNISEAEWEVMKVVWTRRKVRANDVIDDLSEKTHWKPKTIRTLINRLAQKKVLGYEKDGREYLYYPLVSEQECIRAETHSFIKRVCNGGVRPMLAAFLEHENLSSEDIAELKRILDNKEGQ